MNVVLKEDRSSWDNLVKKVSQIANRLTGVQLGDAQASMVEARLRRRLSSLGLITPEQYLSYLEKNEQQESQALVSLMTTHYTFFFREFLHFECLEKQHLGRLLKNRSNKKLKIWSAACSLGQEAYSISMFLNHIKNLKTFSDFSYEIIGSDVDPQSVSHANNGVYLYKEVSQIPFVYLTGNWARGSGEIHNYVKAKSIIKNNLKFETANLLNLGNKYANEKFDIIFCRNVLIYFNQEQIKSVVKSLMDRLADDGVLILGVCESVSALNLPLKNLGHSVYMHKNSENPSDGILDKTVVPLKQVSKQQPIRVLCVDDSPTILALLGKILVPEQGFQIVATAKSAQEAREKLSQVKPDIVTLDLHMPSETGIEYLEKDFNSKHPPVLILSSIERDGTDAANQALKFGASDYVEKPDVRNLTESAEEIRIKLKMILKN